MILSKLEVSPSHMMAYIILHRIDISGTKGLCKEKKFKKIRVYYGSGWVGGSRSHSKFFIFSGKFIPRLLKTSTVYSVCIHC